MLSDELFKKDLEKANNHVYMSEDIKNIVSDAKVKSSFDIRISAIENTFAFKIQEYINQNNLILTFKVDLLFVFDLLQGNIRSIEILLNDKTIKSLILKNNLFYYKISLLDNNIYLVELEILKEQENEQ